MIALAFVTFMLGMYVLSPAHPELYFFLGVGYMLTLFQINKIKE